MSKRTIFLGMLYPPQEETQILTHSKVKVSNAPSVFQWHLIRGMEVALGHSMELVSVLPVGAWPYAYQKPFLPDRVLPNGDAVCHEVGCINLPFIKQGMRAIKAAKLLRKMLRPGDRVVLYSTYMPFLRALKNLPEDIDVTVIVTDLPEFYDLGQTSSLQKFLRRMQNRIIDRCIDRIDRFVLLTEQMTQPMRVGNRPWMLMEGICSAQADAATATPERAILYSGTLHRQFGIHTLLEAFSKLTDPDVQLWLCGSGDLENEIREQSKKDPRIVFHGFVSQAEVAALRSRASVLVNPRTPQGEYTHYTFPSKTMEYMASGKPVVMYRLAGIPQEYDPYLYYVPNETPEALVQTLAWVLEHPEEAQEKGRRAQAFVLENKSSVAQGRRLVEFLNTPLPRA